MVSDTDKLIITFGCKLPEEAGFPCSIPFPLTDQVNIICIRFSPTDYF
jgi:hypothetical protein